MDSILSVERHDYRELARVTLSESAARDLKAWKRRTWTEFHGHGTGQTKVATGAVAELLAAIGEQVKALETAEGWAERNCSGSRGNYHAVIMAESGALVHATAVGVGDGGGLYLAG